MGERDFHHNPRRAHLLSNFQQVSFILTRVFVIYKSALVYGPGPTTGAENCISKVQVFRSMADTAKGTDKLQRLLPS